MKRFSLLAWKYGPRKENSTSFIDSDAEKKSKLKSLKLPQSTALCLLSLRNVPAADKKPQKYFGSLASYNRSVEREIDDREFFSLQYDEKLVTPHQYRKHF